TKYGNLTKPRTNTSSKWFWNQFQICQLLTWKCGRYSIVSGAVHDLYKAKIEYIHQDTKAVISTVDTALDTHSIQKVFTEQQQWWNGQRGTRGVEAEYCWKCHFCKFSELCEWREIMAAKQGCLTKP
ncbi:unnamed protein product, partial [Lymnaea stagnalis]